MIKADEMIYNNMKYYFFVNIYLLLQKISLLKIDWEVPSFNYRYN